MYKKGFCFKDDLSNLKNSFVYVSEDELYTPSKGYGFIKEENIREQELLQIPTLTNGFKRMEMISDRPIPTMFRVEVGLQGNYMVEIEAENDGSEAQLFFERRRMYYVGNFTGVEKFSFAVNVCDIIPEGKQRVYRDTEIDVSWVGNGIRVRSIEIKEINCPTIYIAGDSTVTDQPADYPYSPGCSYCGWGQMLPCFLSNKVAVSNHAHSGLTTETFRKEGHYSVIIQFIKPGDYFFMQFGHNDQKILALKEDKGYRENIKRYVSEIRSQGAFPVIVTSLARNTWRNSGESYLDLLSDYADECLWLGNELDVPVLDLHALSMNYIKENGLEKSKKVFFPGDLSHANDYGAYMMAGFVAREMYQKCKDSKVNAYKSLSTYANKDEHEWKIDDDKLVLPKYVGKEENAQDEPYKLKMDRLEEIIRSKN